MTSQIRSHIEYLIPTYVLVLLFCSHILLNLTSMTGFKYDLMITWQWLIYFCPTLYMRRGRSQTALDWQRGFMYHKAVLTVLLINGMRDFKPVRMLMEAISNSCVILLSHADNLDILSVSALVICNFRCCNYSLPTAAGIFRKVV